MDKINIYVPINVGKIIESDASLFEILKRDGRTINKNRYLSMLIKGYYGQYVQEYTEKYDAIKVELTSSAESEVIRNQLADNIFRNVIMPEVPARKGKNPKRLSLKPTKDTESLIIKIMTDLDGSDYISQYFCRLLMSYCEKSLNEREQIIFRENYKMLDEACHRGKSVEFTTIWNRNIVHEVVPYRIAIGQDEMFNYLICAEMDNKTGIQVAKSYRLNRITNLNYSDKIPFISERVKGYLDMMLHYGPQYAINDSGESCVKLTNNGEKSYNRIYYGRPIVDHIEHRNGAHFYYFKGSKEQIFLYFRRFGYEDAIIISPSALIDKMITFHRSALKPYLDGDV